MARLNLLLTCTALASAELCVDNCEVQSDQTALLQSHLSRKGELSAHHAVHFPALGNLKNTKHRRSSLAQFEDTATSLLRDRQSVTPGMIALVESIIDMLQGSTVGLDTPPPHCADADCGALGAILDEHDNDENLADTQYAELEALVTRSAAIQADVNAHGADATVVGSRLHRLAEHTTCRASEDVLCTTLGECLTNEATLQQNVDNLEAQLVAKDFEINNEWCVEETCADNSVDTSGCNDHGASVFQRASRTLFTDYISILGQLRSAQSTLTNAQTICQANQASWSTARTECDAKQNTFEQYACQYEHVVGADISSLQTDWDREKAEYNLIISDLTRNVLDRKVEWTTIRKVVCLLDALRNPSDPPDDTDQSSYDEAVIAACHVMPVDTTHLDLSFLDPPALVVPTAGSYSATCSDEFKTQNYGQLGQCHAPGGASYSIIGVIGTDPDTIGAAESNCLCTDPLQD